jgi:putative ABC transport system substrate-binding protein
MMPSDGATKLGALMSYSYSTDWSIQAPISYIDRILKGQTTGELPVQIPTKYQHRSI